MATSINAELLAISGARNPYEGARVLFRKRRLRICSWLMVILIPTGSTCRDAGKELRNDHERWRDIQEYYADLTKVESI